MCQPSLVHKCSCLLACCSSIKAHHALQRMHKNASPPVPFAVPAQPPCVLPFLHSHTHEQGWPKPYIHTVQDRMYGSFPAKSTVRTLYIRMNVWFWPTLLMSCCWKPGATWSGQAQERQGIKFHQFKFANQICQNNVSHSQAAMFPGPSILN